MGSGALWSVQQRPPVALAHSRLWAFQVLPSYKTLIPTGSHSSQTVPLGASLEGPRPALKHHHSF